MEEQIKTETKPSDRTPDTVTKQPSLASVSEEQEIRQPVKSSQEPVHSSRQPVISSQEPVHSSRQPVILSQVPVHSSANKEPVKSQSQSSQEPGLALVEEQRRTSVPLFQGGAGFKPFIRDPQKQERYEKYLALVKQGHRGKNLIFILFFF